MTLHGSGICPCCEGPGEDEPSDQHGVYVVLDGRVHYVESYPTRREAQGVAEGLNRNPQTGGYYYAVPETTYAISVEADDRD